MTQLIHSVDDCVERIIATVGKNIVLALPLGLGKANHLANGLFLRAKKDPQLNLHIVTALSLEVPATGSGLRQRFLKPFVERIYSSYPQLLYAQARRNGNLPTNVRVSEFFFNPGTLLNNTFAQRHYFCSNYTHAIHDLLTLGVNVVTQMIAPHPRLQTKYSLSCNPDITFDLLKHAEVKKHNILMVGQVNQQLPYLSGQSEVDEDFFNLILGAGKNEDEGYTDDFPLFVVPPGPVSLSDYVIALHVASLIQDGGTLQIGIGSLGDAISQILTLRHHNNDLFQHLLNKLQSKNHISLRPNLPPEKTVFKKGLYAASEMLVEGLMYLHAQGILTRKVYPNALLQALINQGRIEPKVGRKLVKILFEEECIHLPLRSKDLYVLQTLGCLDKRIRWCKGDLQLNDNETLTSQAQTQEKIINLCAGNNGKPLKGGTYCHAGFYIGSANFYKQLRALEGESYHGLNMCSVDFTNHLYGDETLKRAQRLHARFVNTGMKATLDGAIISDGLKNMQVVSGVGGQYNFIAQAHELENGRSIICIPSTRTHAGKLESNILWDYPHTTIPRHLRDIVVTEYGAADLRSQSDREVILRMLAIADSRFQRGLLAKAKRAGKLEKRYQIPQCFQNNYPHTLKSLLLTNNSTRNEGQQHFPYYPLGTDFTREEMTLAVAMELLKQHGSRLQKLVPCWLKGWCNRNDGRENFARELERMALLKPTSIREWLYQVLLIGGLSEIDKKRPLLNPASTTREDA